MPSIDNHIDKIFIDKDTYLFSRGERWSVRRNLPGQPPFIRALKIRSNVDEKTNYKAIAKAQSLLDEATERLALDLPINVLTVERLAAEFLKQGEEGVRINEEAGKIISYLNISPGRGEGKKERERGPGGHGGGDGKSELQPRNGNPGQGGDGDVKVATLDNPCLLLSYFAPRQALMVERPWEEVLEAMPAPLYRHRYGT